MFVLAWVPPLEYAQMYYHLLNIYLFISIISIFVSLYFSLFLFLFFLFFFFTPVVPFICSQRWWSGVWSAGLQAGSGDLRLTSIHCGITGPIAPGEGCMDQRHQSGTRSTQKNKNLQTETAALLRAVRRPSAK